MLIMWSCLEAKNKTLTTFSYTAKITHFLFEETAYLSEKPKTESGFVIITQRTEEVSEFAKDLQLAARLYVTSDSSSLKATIPS
jgi:hypothetical protein